MGIVNKRGGVVYGQGAAYFIFQGGGMKYFAFREIFHFHTGGTMDFRATRFPRVDFCSGINFSALREWMRAELFI
jgi:hypothetical protein